MGGSSSQAPPVYTPPIPQAPDPYATAQAQEGYNINSAIAQNYLNNINQSTPYGSISYAADGGANVDGHWVPHYTATTTLSPELKKLADTGISNAQGNANIEGQLLQNVKDTASKPLDLSWGNIASNIYGLEKNTLDPQWQHNQQQLDQQLADQGLTPGSEGAGYQRTQFGLDKSNAYNNAMLAAQGQAVSDITQQYNSPINTLSALRSNSQIQQPGVGQTASSAQGQIGAAPYANVAQSNYAIGSQNFNAAQALQQQAYQNQAQMQNTNQNQLFGGLFGLGSSVLGAFSDERDKTDLKRLGKDKATGLPIYAYRYKDDPKTYPKAVGPMAQDVEKIAPSMVSEIGGHKVIKFGLGG
jgi:endosialidase-like protein